MRCFILLLLVASVQSRAATRHAFVVAIDKYYEGLCTPKDQKDRGFTLTPPKGSKGCPTESDPNLKNAVADGDRFVGMLKGRFLFTQTEITYLKNQQATASAILTNLRMVMKKLQAGDQAIFYFAGHGTLVHNISEPNNKREALVPWDFLQGTYPILDFELFRIYEAATKKQIQLTVVIDSCFGGGMARGTRLRRMPEFRSVKQSPAKFEGRGTFAFIAGARGEQPATDAPKTFTQALVEVVEDNPMDLSISDLARLTQSRMLYKQSPVAEGEASETVSIVGKSIKQDALTYLITKVEGAKITIGAGQANGLAVGSGFVLEGKEASSYKLVELGPAQALLEPETKVLPLVRAGMRVKLVRRVMGQKDGMRVYMPSALPTSKEMESLRSCLANTDPGLDAKGETAYRVAWSGSNWELTSPDGKVRPFQCEILRSLNGVALTVAIPPTKDLKEKLQTGLGAYQDLIQENVDAPYEVIGRIREGSLEYALAKRFPGKDEMLASVTKWNRDWKVVRNAANQAEPLEYPEETENVDCGKQMEFCSQMLVRRIQRARILMDLLLMESTSSHVISDEKIEPNPWRIELREKAGKECTRQRATEAVAMKQYCLVAAYSGPRNEKLGWYLHVITIDGAGLLNSYRLDEKKYFDDVLIYQEFYSIPSEGNRENFFLFATTEGSLSQLQLTEEFQKPPVTGRGRGMRSPTVGFNSARASSPRPSAWALTSTTIPIRPNSN